MKRYAKIAKSRIAKVGALVAVTAMTTANAALTAPTIDTADFYTVAGAIIAAAGVFYAVRKALSLMR